jgi:hypothetical protein
MDGFGIQLKNGTLTLVHPPKSQKQNSGKISTNSQNNL